MKQMTAKELANKIERQEEVHVVDVREEEEVATGKIPGSVHIPLSLFATEANKLDQNTPYVLICQSGGRSGMACRMLEQHGFDVCNVSDGIAAWTGEIE